MEELKILEKLYAEARKIIPGLERKLLWRDLDNEIVTNDGQGMRIYFQDCCLIANYTRLSEISLKYLKSKGFSSSNPSLQEFLKKNGFEREITTFMQSYTSAVKLVSEYNRGQGIQEAREQGIKDAEMQARAHNRNRNYKESWEGDD